MTDLTTMLAEKITADVERANAITDKVAAATTNVNKQLHDLRNDKDTTDEAVRKYQAFIADLDARREQATSAIEAHLRDNVLKVAAMGEDERATLRSEYDTLRDEINTALKLLKMYDEDGSVTNGIPALRNFSGRKGSGGASGGKRPRLGAATVNDEDVFTEKTDKDGNTVRHVTFTILAQNISKDAGEKVTPRMLQEAAFEEAGTDDLSTVSEVDFGYSVNGKNYRIKVWPASADDEATESDDSETTEATETE